MDLAEYFEVMEITEIKNPETGVKYQIHRFIGSGASGYVFEVSHSRDVRDSRDLRVNRYAAKMTTILADYETELEVYDQVSRFAPAGISECNPYIVCLYDNFIADLERPTGVLILELMDSDLDTNPPSNSEIPDLMIDTLSALVTLHSHKIAHQDIREANIFRSRANHDGAKFKLGDFSNAIVDATLSEMRKDDYALASYFNDLNTKGVFRDIGVNMLNSNVKDRWSSNQALNYIQQ